MLVFDSLFDSFWIVETFIEKLKNKFSPTPCNVVYFTAHVSSYFLTLLCAVVTLARSGSTLARVTGGGNEITVGNNQKKSN